tara:strand:+ start:831 stop:1709 length:879 start_codon:yes stop_codon:yes gene_type:complete
MINVRCARLVEKDVMDHWKSTILKKRELDEIAPFLTNAQYKIFKDSKEKYFELWGDTDRTLKRAKPIETGDPIIFYGEKKFHTKAKGGIVIQNEELANYFWPPKSINSNNNDELPWRNIYTLIDRTDINIHYYPSDFLTRDKKVRQAREFRGGEYLKNFQLTKEFLSKLEIGWDEGINSNEHTRRGMTSNTFWNKPAQIYKVSFSVDGKNMIYVGQDLKCDEKYFGSSLVIYHYKKIYGEKIFEKEILENLRDLTKGEINKIESDYINQEKNKIENQENCFSLNYTGENQQK